MKAVTSGSPVSLCFLRSSAETLHGVAAFLALTRRPLLCALGRHDLQVGEICIRVGSCVEGN